MDCTDDQEKFKYALFKCIAKVIQLEITFTVISADSVNGYPFNQYFCLFHFQFTMYSFHYKEVVKATIRRVNRFHSLLTLGTVFDVHDEALNSFVETHKTPNLGS